MNKSPIFNKKFFQYAALVIIFCFLALMQTALFGRLAIYGTQLNLIFIAVFLLGFFTSRDEEPGEKSNSFAISAGAVGGFLLDVFSSLPFGAFTITFLILALLIKKSHALFHKSNIAAFIIAFLLSFLFYKICFAILAMLLVLVFTGSFSFIWPIKPASLIELLYNFIIAGLVFLFFRLKQ